MKKKLAILLIVAMIFNTSGTITLADAFNNVAPTETKETDKFFDGLAEDESLSLDEETTENTEEPENDNEDDAENLSDEEIEGESQTEDEPESDDELESDDEPESDGESEESANETAESINDEGEVESESAESETLEDDIEETTVEQSETTSQSSESNESVEEKANESTEETVEESETSLVSETESTESTEATKETKAEIVEISSKSEIDEEVATASDALLLGNNQKLFGARNYLGKLFHIYFHFDKDINGITLPSAAMPGDVVGPYTNSTSYEGRFQNKPEHLDYMRFPFDTRDIIDLLELKEYSDQNIYYDSIPGFPDENPRVRIIYGKTRERMDYPMYYVKDMVAKGENNESYTIGLGEWYDGQIYEIDLDAFTEIEHPEDPRENYYELHFYPKEYHGAVLSGVNLKFIDENDALITEYNDSLSLYNEYRRFNEYFNFADDYRRTNFVVYEAKPDNLVDGIGSRSAYTVKAPDYENLASLAREASNNRFYQLYKQYKTYDEESWDYIGGDYRESTEYYNNNPEGEPDSIIKYDSKLDKRVNSKNPYYYVFEFVPEKSDVAEFPLSLAEKTASEDSRFENQAAHVTSPWPDLYFRVRLVTSINFYNNDGSKKYNDSMITANTLVVDKKWPSAFSEGLSLIEDFNITGWALEPNKGKEDDVSKTIAGTEVLPEHFDSNGALNLYAVGDPAETWTIRYEKNLPDNLHYNYTTDKEPVDREFVSIGSVLYDKKTGKQIEKISVGSSNYDYYDKGGEFKAIYCDAERAYTDEDGTIIAAGTDVLANITSAEQIRSFFGDDHEKVYKINYFRMQASIDVSFLHYGTTEYIGNIHRYATKDFAPFSDIKVDDDVFETVLNDELLIDFFKDSNVAYINMPQSQKDAYTFNVADKWYDETCLYGNYLVKYIFHVDVWLTSNVSFKYFSSDGQEEITYKVADSCKETYDSKYPRNPVELQDWLAREGQLVSEAYVSEWAIATNSRIPFNDWGNDFTGYTKFYAIENYDYYINYREVDGMQYDPYWPYYEPISYKVTTKELDSNYKVITDTGIEHIGWDINGTKVYDTSFFSTFTADGLGSYAIKGKINITPLLQDIKYTVNVKSNGKATFENGLDNTQITDLKYRDEVTIPNYTVNNGYYFINYSVKDSSGNEKTFTNKQRIYNLYPDNTNTVTIELNFGKYRSLINFDSTKVKQQFIDDNKNIFVADFDSTAYNFDNMASDDAIKKANIPMVDPSYRVTSFEGPNGVTFEDTNADMATAIKNWRSSNITSDYVITAKYTQNSKFIYAYIDNTFGTFDYPQSSIEKTTIAGKTFNKIKLYSNGSKIVVPKIVYNAGYGFDSYCQDSNYSTALANFATWAQSWTGDSDAPTEYQNVYIKTRTLKYIEFVIEDTTKGKWSNNYKYLQVWSEDLSSADLDTYANLVYAAEEKNVIIDIPNNLTFRGISESKVADANSSGANILTLSGLKSLFNTWKTSTPLENKTLYVHFANNTTFTFLYNSDIVRLVDGKAVITAKERHNYSVPTFESAIAGVDLNIKWYIDSADTYFTGDRNVSYTDAEVLQQYNDWVQNPFANRVLSPRYMLPSGDNVTNGCIILEVDENKIASMNPRKFVWTYDEFQSGKSAFTLTAKTGYTFYRWVDRADSSTYADTLAGLNPAANKLVVYTAQFNDAKKKLTLIVDNTKGTLNGLFSTNVFNDPTYFLNNRDYIYVTKKTEERFAGWKDLSDNKIYKTLSLYNWDGSEDVTLEAVFKTDPVLTITVDSNKGTYTGKTSYEDLAQFNQDKATIKNSLTPLPTYKFDGWTGSNSVNYKDDLSDYTWDASDDFTLTARFSLIIKHLTFETDTNKGTFDSSAKLSYDTSELGSIAAPTVNRKLGYAFLNWVKKGTTTVFDPTTWDGVADLVLVANFEQLAIFKFDIPMADVQDVTGDTEFDPQSGTITRPTVTPKTGKKQDGWTVNGEYKTDAEVDNIIRNWDQVSDIVIKVLLVELKTLKFEINQDKATIDPSAKLSFDSDDTSITRPSFTVKKGYGLDYWKKGNISVQDADLAADIAAWRALTESKKEHVIYVAIFRKLKEFRFTVDDNMIDPANPINKDDLVFDESNPPQTSNVPSVTPRYGYNNPSDNGGWTNKKGGTKADILTPEQLRDIINDWNSKPSDQKPDVELYYVFVEDDTIPKVKFVVDRTKGGFNGGTVYTDTTDFDNAKSSINVVAFNNYKFVGWKDTTTNEQFANASLITWDGSATKVYEAVFDVVSTNNGGGNNGGGGRSGGDSSSDSYDVKPPQGYNNDINGPFNPMDPNQPPKPQQPVNPQDEMSSEEKIANPPSGNFLIVRMDTATSENDNYLNANLGANGGIGSDKVFKWETRNGLTWRLMEVDNVVENIDYVKTLDVNVVGSLETDRIIYYKDGWAFLEYKGTKEWYHFGLNHIMDTGWIYQDGNIYYLQTEINTTYGKMFTGVHTIDGVKYEFGKNGVLKGIVN